MNRLIKFRGYDVENGDYVYGEFGVGATSNEPVIYFYDRDAQQWVGATVDPESVAQLCGYDSNGDEIYEGDQVSYDGGTQGLLAALFPSEFFSTMTLIKETG